MISQNPRRSALPYNRWLRTILLFLVLVGMAWFTTKVIRAITLVRQLEQTVTTLQIKIDGVAKTQDIDSVLPMLRHDLATAATTTEDLRQIIWPFGGLLKTLTWVPVYGHDLAAIPPMLDMTSSLLSSIHYLDIGISPTLDRFRADQSSDKDIVALLSETISTQQEEFGSARRELENAYAARQQIGDVANLHPRLQSAITQSDRAMSALSQILTILDALPELLGEKEPNHVLILLQNADELRPTGGFITYTIYLVLDKGKIAQQSTLPSTGSQIDQVNSVVYDLPPRAYEALYGHAHLLFRDANWFPDFPTTATKAAQLYTTGRHVPVDTVIAINQYTIQSVLRDIGPIMLRDGTQIDDRNIIDQLQTLWDQYRSERGLLGRKDFIPELVPQMFDRVLHVKDTQGILTRMKAIQGEAATGDLLVYSTRPEIQGIVEAVNLDGGIDYSVGDYLHVVDTNIGVNKTDINVARDLSYHTNLADPIQPYAVLRLSYANESTGEYGKACLVKTKPVISYLQEADDCYVNYLRLYVTENSNVIKSPTFTLPDNFLYAKGSTREGEFQHLLSEQGKEVYGVLMIVNPGETLQPSFIYRLSPKNIFTLQPDGTIGYDLLVKRQPGVRERPSTVAIDLPPNSQVVEVTPKPASQNEQVITFESRLDSGSLQIHLVLRLSPDMQKQLVAILPPPLTQPLPTSTPRLVPTDIPLSTVIPTDTAIPFIGIQASVTDRAILRKGPGTTFNAISTLSAGEMVIVLGRDKSGLWVFVARTSTGGKGWVSAKLVTGLPAISTLPLQPDVATLPTPTATSAP